MSESKSDRRLAENEVIFREANQKMRLQLKELKKTAEEEGHNSIVLPDKIALHFYCECVRPDCFERIVITPSEYESVRKNSSQFLVLPGHNYPKIERIVTKADGYLVVEKFITPPYKVDGLNPFSK